VTECSKCGEVAEGARFCPSCGNPLTQEDPSPSREQRKIVSIVFCDLAGSTAMGEKLDPESLRRVMLRYYAELRFALEHHGGTVEKFIGDAVMAVFGIPAVHEDDALRAVRAASDMMDALARLNDELEQRWGVRLHTRTGVNTGKVVAGDPTRGEGFVVGDAVNVAARLEQHAPTDEILLGEDTYQLVRGDVEVEPVEPMELKGKSGRVPAFKLVSVSKIGISRRLDSPIVGRDRELAQLERAFDSAVDRNDGQLVSVVGPAGMGKSRLMLEFLSSVRGRATVLRGRCLPYGDGITFWPISEVVKEAAGIGGDDSPQEARDKMVALLPEGADRETIVLPVAAAIGLSDAAYQAEEIFLAIRRLIEALAAEQPLVLTLDDVHWAEETFLDLVEYLADTIRDSRVLLLCIARLELREVRPSILRLADRRDVIVLEPLAADESERLVRNLLGSTDLPQELGDRITAAAQGNPLFVEEMLRMLVDQGMLSTEKGSWSVEGDLSEVGVPLTLEALLTARLEGLSSGERTVVECASVIGEEFWPAAVERLAPEGERSDVSACLESLVDKDLVTPGGQSFGGESAYRFGHIMIRDVAYGNLLKESRSALHEGFGDWLEKRAGQRVNEYGEILGYHFERAFRTREELGPVDDEGRALAARAFSYLSTAGRDAHGRGDMPAAVKLLERSIGLADERDPGRLELMLGLGQALFHVNEVERARDVFNETAGAAESFGDRALAFHALIERADMEAYIDPDVGLDQLRDVAEEAIPLFTEQSDEAGLARSWRALSVYNSDACRWGKAGDALEQALEHAVRAGDRELYLQIIGGLAIALFVGPAEVERGIARLEDVLAAATGSRHGGSGLRAGPSAIALIEACGLAGLKAMSGDLDHGRELCSRGKRTLAELGQERRVVGIEVVAARIEVMAGEPAAAESEFRSAYATLDEIGDKNVLSTVAAELSDVLYAQGRYDDALELSREGETLAAPEDVESQIRWRTARAKLCAHDGDDEQAVRIAREALEHADGIEFPNLEASAQLALTEVHRLAGRETDAAECTAAALAIFEEKGNRPSAAMASAALERLRSADRS
jgi:class 3 adenylate cyclase/tetratricopeptide (TPR) repeat protein